MSHLKAGGDVPTMQPTLGHTSPRMVNHYVHLARSEVMARHRRNSTVDRLQLPRAIRAASAAWAVAAAPRTPTSLSRIPRPPCVWATRRLVMDAERGPDLGLTATAVAPSLWGRAGGAPGQSRPDAHRFRGSPADSTGDRSSRHVSRRSHAPSRATQRRQGASARDGARAAMR